jgi:N utilization substance protein A
MSDIIRYIDTIARDKEIDREGLFEAVEQAMAQALSKKYGVEDLVVTVNRDSGKLDCNYEVDFEHEGRITAQAVKQAIISKVREQERDVLYGEFETKIGEIVTGTVQRFEGDAVIVNLGRNMEGTLPRAEKVRGEVYNIGDRLRAMVLEVKKSGPRVKIILSRAHKDLVRCLFELEVPEIAEGIIEIRRIEREPGYRTKVAVHSSDEKVDCVGACVGVRGTRIKSIIDELNSERIDIIRWNNEPEVLITNALKPAEISHIQLDEASRKALVLVDEDQLSLAIGRKGQNVRLASRLTHWDIDIMTRAELEKSIADEDAQERALAEAEGDSSAGEAEPGPDSPPPPPDDLAPEAAAESYEEPSTVDSTAEQGGTAESSDQEPES